MRTWCTPVAGVSARSPAHSLALAAAPANEDPGADDDWGENEAKGDDADEGGNANENKDEEDDGDIRALHSFVCALCRWRRGFARHSLTLIS